MSPSLTCSDSRNGRLGRSGFSGYLWVAFAGWEQGANFKYLGNGCFCAGSANPASDLYQAVLDGVQRVLAACDPFKIFGAIVSLHPVFVVHKWLVERIGNERLRNQPVNGPVFDGSGLAIAKHHPEIAVPHVAPFQLATALESIGASQRENAPILSYFIPPIMPYDGANILVCHASIMARPIHLVK